MLIPHFGKSRVELGFSASEAARLGRLIRTCARVSFRPLNALRPLFASFALNALCARFTLRALWALNSLLSFRARIARVSFRALVARIALFPFEIMERKRKGFSRIRPARSDRNRRGSHSIIYSGSDFPKASSSTSRPLRPSVTLWPGISLRPLRPDFSSRPSVTGITFISLGALRPSIAFSALQLPLRQPLSPIRGVPHVNGVRLSCTDVVHLALPGLSYSCLQCPQRVISPKDVQAGTGIAFIPFGALRAYRPLGANVTGITFYTLRTLGASHAHRGRIIQPAIVSPANDALA